MNAAEQSDLEQRLVLLAVADAPPITVDQTVELRRVLKPYLPGRAALVAKTPIVPGQAAA